MLWKLSVAVPLILAATVALADPTLTGAAAFGDWTTDAPGVRRLITPDALPAPDVASPANNPPTVQPMPADARLKVPPGFAVTLFASHLTGPRTIRVAPNGDIFVVESAANRVHVFRAADGAATPSADSIFADGLNNPSGLAFFPPGPFPLYVYVSEPGRIVRFPYRTGDLKATGLATSVLGGMPTEGHNTRDILFSPDGTLIYIAMGTASNAGEGLATKTPDEIAPIEALLGVGSAWDAEQGRGSVFTFGADGRDGKDFANGIRNCSGMALQPATGNVWCATNERDGLGDNVPPDYVSRIKPGAFYGWPWFYIGSNQDPRHAGERADLAGKVTVPDILLQAHSAPLALAFYDGTAFPAEYRGDAFATLHGSWNRGKPTGYKVVRLVMKDNLPTGEYEDFLTGFVSNGTVWGRPTGIAVAHDGALLVSEDGNGTIWRVAPTH